MTITQEIINNYKRNKRWLDWFLERHKTFLSRLDFGHGGAEPSKEQIEAIKTYFTEQEQKIIGWGLSHTYMLEKFRGHCLGIAPNLSLVDFQKLCYSWWASEKKEISHKELVNKGKLSSEQWEELNKILKEEELEREAMSANNFFERKLEEWLSQEISKPTLREYHRECNPEKRAEILKERDIEMRNYRKNRLIKIEEYYKKNKDTFPELNKFLEEKIEEERKEIEGWEKAIKETNYLEWSKRTMTH